MDSLLLIKPGVLTPSSTSGLGWVRQSTFALTMLGLLNSAMATGETLLERGTYLVNSIVACGNCHTPPAGPLQDVEFAGTFLIEEPPFTAFAANITQDKETGIGSWSDTQLVKAIREGIRPNGSLIGPPMPIDQYRGLSDRGGGGRNYWHRHDSQFDYQTQCGRN